MVVAAPLRNRTALRFAAAVGLLLALGGIALFLADRWATRHAASLAAAAASDMARTHAGLLTSELQKYRLLPLVLSDYSDVRDAVGSDAQAISRLNRRLELLAAGTNAAVIYVIDAHGRTVAASNWKLPTSFVGHNYSFRYYFSRALRDGDAEQFAQGAVSQRPGLFLSHRIVAADRQAPIGVVVVKVEFVGLEANWSHQPGPTLVTDAQDRIVVTSDPALRFRGMFPRLHPAGAGPILSREGVSLVSIPSGGAKPLGAAATARLYVEAREPVPVPGWKLSYLQPLEPFEEAALNQYRAAMLGVGIVLLTAFGLALRAHERRVLQRRTRQMLEEEVERRTAELRQANERQKIAAAEREGMITRLGEARDELAQANRLASIGQITAGVAHEINQPVAAIRTFSENAARFLERGDRNRAVENLEAIVGLTERIGTITGELRSFARRRQPGANSASVRKALDGALLLIGNVIATRNVTLVQPKALADDLIVVADPVRLEQVLVNLLQNALDALEGVPNGIIRIAVEQRPEQIRLVISDNGPGVPPQLADTIFTPFTTSKEQGLGLGLGIARDILREFGGEITMSPPAREGATFIVLLRRPQ
jgi:two-component system C4-dicarboxylate transport sensor histidine kinase DctB